MALFADFNKNSQPSETRITACNFSYPQAGFWWLVERKFVFLKAAYRRQFIGKHPACV
jgi:hypothetical protein